MIIKTNSFMSDQSTVVRSPERQRMNPPGNSPAAGSGAGQHSNLSPMAPKLQQTSNMYSQLETMMQNVKKEAKSLEAVKQKIREMDGLTVQVGELKSKLQEAQLANEKLQISLVENESISGQLRGDMQRLNDIYSEEHERYNKSQQVVVKLETDVRNALSEMQFYQKEAQRIPELRKKNQSLISQISVIQKEIEEEKVIVKQTNSKYEEKIALAATEKQEHTKQFWKMSEDIKNLKFELNEKNILTKDSEAIINDLKIKALQAKDREGMTYEENLSSLTLIQDKKNQMSSELAAARAESDALRDVLNHKEDQTVVLHAKLRNIEEARQTEKSEVKGKIAALTETIHVLKTKNHDLEREASEAQHQLGLVGGDVTRYTMEVETLQAELSRNEVAKQQREADYKRQLDAHIRERDDAIEKLQKATNNFEAMQNEARNGQARYWEELQRVKEAESQLTDEADKLATELEEKSAKLVMVEAERTKLEEYMRGEVSGAMQMTSALRTELERRLEELSLARKEADESKEDKIINDKKMEEMKQAMERQENNFKRTLETDRNKINGEIKSKMQKLRGLEIEKQELLMETSNLMKQVEITQKEIQEARIDAAEAQKEAKIATMRVQELIDEKEISDKQAKSAVQAQDELREHANRLESSFKDDIGRLDSLVKESKKAAAQQVLDITERVRHANEEVEIVNAKIKHAEENEKKAIEQAETLRVQMEIQAKSHEDMQQQMAKDMTTMRRELQENRSKAKITSESRTKMEMEVMNARMEATKAENEVIKMTEWCREIDTKMTQANVDIQKYKTERNELDRDYKKLKIKQVEIEESISKKNTANEQLVKDMAKLEREGLSLTRTMKLQLQASEQECNELKVTVPLLQKELFEGKKSYEKLQNSTNETVNGLLEELRNTEDTLSSERKHGNHDVDTYRRKITELTTALDKANDHINETASRHSKGQGDREVRMLQLEQELERIKSAVIKKEQRMDELEKQHQNDRKRIHEMKENLDNAERSISDSRTTLELEQGQRKRLEMRIKALTEADRNLTPRNGAGGSDSTTPGGGGDSSNTSNALDIGFTPSSIEKRTQMLYGDVDDEEPEYDDVANHYQLDHESTLAAITDTDKDININKKSSPNTNKMQKIISSGVTDDDDDFMAQTANNPMVAAFRAQEQAEEDEAEANLNATSFSKDTGNPVVDRVSQALAARAAADSSKANLKAMNMKRQEERNSKHMDDQSGDIGNKSNLVQGVRDMVTSASETAIGDNNDGATGPGGDVEDSIQRTQMFLRNRLAQRANGGKPSASTTNVRSSGLSGNSDNNYISEEEQASIAAKEAQRIAEMAYERHGKPSKGNRENFNNENNYTDDDDDGDGDVVVMMKAPNLSPAKPMNSINGGFSTKNLSSGGRIVYEDDLEEGNSASASGVQLPHIHKGKKKR